MREKEEFVEVTVKVPKRVMRMLEEENYFDWPREDFFRVCVKRGLSCEILGFDIDVIEKLEQKYGKQWVDNATTVRMGKRLLEC